MKRKIYFIIASLISFLLSIYSIVVSDETVKETIKELKNVYEGFPKEFQDRIIGIYQNAGVKLTILFAIIVMISSIILFIFAINNTLLKHKGLVIALSIFCFFFTDRALVQLLGVISFIVILCCRRTNPEDFPDKVKKIPEIKLKKSATKDIVLGIILFAIYFSQFIWSKYLPDRLSTNIIIEICFNILMFILCIITFKNQLKENITIFKDNFKSYMKLIFSKLGITYIFVFLFSLISILITKKATSINQEILETLPLYYIIPAAVIYAPIVEEILFRGVVRKFIKNNIIFIIVSALSFGLLHTIREVTIINILVMSLPYTTLGVYLAYLYSKTNNIISNITGHMIINLISVIFMLFI